MTRVSKTDEAVPADRIEDALSSVRGYAWEYNLDTRRYWRSSDRSLAGGLPAPEQPSFEGFLASIHPDDRDRLRQATQNHLNGDAPEIECEYRLRTTGGRWLWVMDRSRVVERDASGRALRLVGMRLDIDAHKRSELALAAREAELRAMVDQALVGVHYRRIDGSLVHMNERFAAILGRSRDELETLLWDKLIHPDDHEETRAQFEAHLASGEPYISDRRFLKPGGDVVWCRSQMSFIKNGAGRVIARVTVLDDITARKEAELALSRREAELSAIHRQALVGICHRELDGTFISANRRYAQILGRTSEEVTGHNWRSFAHPDDISSLEAGFAALSARGEPMIVEHRCLRPDGEIVWCRSYISYILDETDQARSAVIILDDITRQKLAEAQARGLQQQVEQATRALTAGAMGINMAHELQQPHQAASAYIAAARRMLGAQSGQVRQLLAEAQDEIERAGEIVTRLKSIRSENASEPVATSLAQMIDDVIDRCGLRGDPNWVGVAIDDGADTVNVDRMAFQQALEAIVRNAVEATPTSAPIKVTAAPHDEAVCIRVVDQGPGLAPGIADTAFDLFTTTKGGALGLGLPTARTIIEGLGGRIWFEQRTDGHCAVMTLPAVPAG